MKHLFYLSGSLKIIVGQVNFLKLIFKQIQPRQISIHRRGSLPLNQECDAALPRYHVKGNFSHTIYVYMYVKRFIIYQNKIYVLPYPMFHGKVFKMSNLNLLCCFLIIILNIFSGIFLYIKRFKILFF